MFYKLYYFNLRGLAEPVRFLLKYGKIDFEDVRVEDKDWPQLKNTMPTRTMPVLEFDGEKICQSVAICRFLGKKVGLAGSNDRENLEIDVAVDTFVDLRLKIVRAAFGPADEKEATMNQIAAEDIPLYLGKLNAWAEKNHGYLAAKKLTWADLYFVSLKEIPINCTQDKELYRKYPALQKLIEKVQSIDPIKTWVAERPVTDW